MAIVDCPACGRPVNDSKINDHLDSGCASFIADISARNGSYGGASSSSSSSSSSLNGGLTTASTISGSGSASGSISGSGSGPGLGLGTASTPGASSMTQPQKRSASNFFSTPASKRQLFDAKPITPILLRTPVALSGKKRSFQDGPGGGGEEETCQQQQQQQERQQQQQQPPIAFGREGEATPALNLNLNPNPTQNPDPNPNPNLNANLNPPPQSADVEMGEADENGGRAAKKLKTHRAIPLAERMRPTSLDEVCGQDLVGPQGVLRSLIESGRVPSMILWGPSGTGKTTIARCIASVVGSRFVELNATSTGVAECKKLFAEAANELALTGRKTILFCDEIHRFNKTQQDAFLRPVEAGTITLVGATTENPSFKVTNALLSRCRTFTLQPLAPESVVSILQRAAREETSGPGSAYPPTDLVDDEMMAYLARFSDGDARTALNLLELALSLAASRPGITRHEIRQSLTKTLVYDRAGDQHYDTISAFHKSVRGSDPDAALYYLARMLQSGEDPLFVARRMVVIASEDVGLADNSLLPLAVAAYTAAQQIGMPEARIPLAHCAVALCQAPKSTRAYRGLNNAFAALREPGVAALPVPLHLRNAPTRLMRDLGYGAEYKYPPNYRDGKVKQAYLPDELWDRKFLEPRDLGTEVDPDYEYEASTSTSTSTSTS